MHENMIVGLGNICKSNENLCIIVKETNDRKGDGFRNIMKMFDDDIEMKIKTINVVNLA
jgi:hypothetical protein